MKNILIIYFLTGFLFSCKGPSYTYDIEKNAIKSCENRIFTSFAIIIQKGNRTAGSYRIKLQDGFEGSDTFYLLSKNPGYKIIYEVARDDISEERDFHFEPNTDYIIVLSGYDTSEVTISIFTDENAKIIEANSSRDCGIL